MKKAITNDKALGAMRDSDFNIFVDRKTFIRFCLRNEPDLMWLETKDFKDVDDLIKMHEMVLRRGLLEWKMASALLSSQPELNSFIARAASLISSGSMNTNLRMALVMSTAQNSKP